MKISKLLILPLSLVLLTGCPKDNTDKNVYLHYGQMHSLEAEEIDYQTLSEKVDSKESFLLAVYAPGCSCWSTFRSVLAKYIGENHVIVYSISYNAFHSSTGETLDNFGLKLKQGYTSFVIFKDGKAKVDLNSEKKELKEIDAFNKLMESSKVVLPKIFFISKDQVDELYSSEETSLLYFARSNCSDCQYFDRNFLDKYNPSKNMYILDCEKIGIREYDEDGNLTPESQIAWNNFKIEYGLANTNNPQFGYGTGYVPSLFYLHGSGDKDNPQATFLDGAVYFNDSIAPQADNYVITSTYYTNSREVGYEFTSLEGRIIPSADVDVIEYKGMTFYSWKKDKAAEIHNRNVKAFFDKNMDNVTHQGFKL